MAENEILSNNRWSSRQLALVSVMAILTSISSELATIRRCLSSVNSTQAIVMPFRIYSRMFLVRKMGLDDTFMILAWLFMMTYTIMTGIAVKLGLGSKNPEHISIVPLLKVSSFINISFILTRS
jgi:hypothetical protein